MLSRSGDEGIGRATDELLGVPKIERSIFEGTGNNALGVLFRWGTPGNVVESDNTESAGDNVGTLHELVLPRVCDNARNRLKLQSLVLVVEAQIP